MKSSKITTGLRGLHLKQALRVYQFTDRLRIKLAVDGIQVGDAIQMLKKWI